MKIRFNSISWLGVVMFGLVGCNSDNEVECPEDYTGALAATEEKMVGEWLLTAIVSEEEIDLTDDSEENPSTDIYAQYSDCQRDGAYTFSSNRGYTFEQGLRASGCERQVDLAGTWQLASNTISLVGSCNIQNLAIEFNEDSSAFNFSEVFNVTNVQGATVQTEVTFTYTKQ